MPYLTGCPREVRNRIFSYSLCVSTGFFPYERPSFRNPDELPPALGLLSVNKAVRKECLPLLISKNSWVIPALPTLPSNYPTIFNQHGHLFRFITIHFKHCHCWQNWRQNSEANHSVSYDGYKKSLDRLRLEWESKDGILAMLPNVEMIHMDLGTLYCEIVGPQCSSTERMPMLHEVFGEIMQTQIGRYVDVRLQCAYGEESEVVKEWRNRGLEEGDEGPFVFMDAIYVEEDDEGDRDSGNFLDDDDDDDEEDDQGGEDGAMESLLSSISPEARGNVQNAIAMTIGNRG